MLNEATCEDDPRKRNNNDGRDETTRRGSTTVTNDSNEIAIASPTTSSDYGKRKISQYESVMVVDDEMGAADEPFPSSHSSYNSSSYLSTKGWIYVVLGMQIVNVVAIACILIRNQNDYERNNASMKNILSSDSSSPLNTMVSWINLPPMENPLSRIAFGSCSRQDLPQPYWDTLGTYQPDLVILMGDNVYGDCTEPSCSDLRQAYRDWAAHPSFQAATEMFPIIATLDDHDYGKGDCHSDNPYKEHAREFFMDFFQLDASQIPKDGVYRSFVWGPANQRLQIILLDTRYSRSPFIKTGNSSAPYTPYPEGNASTDDYQMLSTQQWEWLENQLSDKKNEEVDLTLIVSSIQVLNDRIVWEGWRHIPNERTRLLNLIASTSHAVILLSGDRHVGGMYEYSTNGRIVVPEVTASSWTHTIPLGAFDSNCSTSLECDEVDSTRLGDLIRENHFGSIDIDWHRRTVSVSLRRTELSADIQPYQRDIPSDAGNILIFRNYSMTGQINLNL